jgi:hypothetical protein
LDTSRLAKGKFLPTTTARKRYRQTEKEDKNANDALKTTNTSRTSSWPSASMASGLRVDLRAFGMVFWFVFFLREKRGGEFCFDETIENFTR